MIDCSVFSIYVGNLSKESISLNYTEHLFARVVTDIVINFQEIKVIL